MRNIQNVGSPCDRLGRSKSSLAGKYPTGLTRCQAKAMAAFLSGEMKDTVQMNPAGAYGVFPSLRCLKAMSL